MENNLSDVDKKILKLIQKDANLSLNRISEKINLSRNACWNRIKQLEKRGIIKSRIAILDKEKLNLSLTVFIAIKTNRHACEWMEAFQEAVKDIPEIVAIYRTAGDTDYLLQGVIPNMEEYDLLYQKLVTKMALSDVSASFVMKEIKQTTELPLDYV